VTGLLAGVFAGAFGIGGATIIIPALIYFFHVNQHQAQGTALAALLPPVGLLAVLKYYYSGNVVVDVALYTAIGFFVGGFFGAVIVQPIPDDILRRAFAVYLMAIAIKMLF
jgi:uncharacterized membrane protein YfcA